MRAPLAPIGWPSATAPPRTLCLAASISSTRPSATCCTANASLNSYRSTSWGDQPVFSQTMRTAFSGAIITSSGARPLEA